MMDWYLISITGLTNLLTKQRFWNCRRGFLIKLPIDDSSGGL